MKASEVKAAMAAHAKAVELMLAMEILQKDLFELIAKSEPEPQKTPKTTAKKSARKGTK